MISKTIYWFTALRNAPVCIIVGNHDTSLSQKFQRDQEFILQKTKRIVRQCKTMQKRIMKKPTSFVKMIRHVHTGTVACHLSDVHLSDTMVTRQVKLVTCVITVLVSCIRVHTCASTSCQLFLETSLRVSSTISSRCILHLHSFYIYIQYT